MAPPHWPSTPSRARSNPRLFRGTGLQTCAIGNTGLETCATRQNALNLLMTARPPAIELPPPEPAPRHRAGPASWLGLPFRWLYQMAHNGHGIVRVLDITRLRPLPHGLISPDHPWVTGVNPATGRYVWHDNVVFRSSRGPDEDALPMDDFVVTKTG